ncbi:hypothetical protein BRD17_04520 [Halobacteriales archaeon SW_7_68_16]|nr:MAG: hypothetical protein BRD17_04520 [Halobacteriales archaeon SW_7_68_16]
METLRFGVGDSVPNVDRATVENVVSDPAGVAAGGTIEGETTGIGFLLAYTSTRATGPRTSPGSSVSTRSDGYRWGDRRPAVGPRIAIARSVDGSRSWWIFILSGP